MPSNCLILCLPLLLLLSIFPSIRVFSNEWVVCIMWPDYISLSISPSSESSGLSSFRQDRLVRSFSPKDSQESSPAPQFKSINYWVLCLLYGLALTSIHDYRKGHNLDYMDPCQKNLTHKESHLPNSLVLIFCSLPPFRKMKLHSLTGLKTPLIKYF